MFRISSFKIKKLFGYKDVILQFKDSVQIYIGENGLGKTTVLNSLFYILSLEWQELANIAFESVSITINKKSYEFTKVFIEAYLKQQDNTRRTGFAQHLSNNLSDEEVARLKQLINNSNSIERIKNVQSFLIEHGYKISASSSFIYNSVLEVLSIRENFKLFDEYASFIQDKCPRILYFPTYRRVEKNLAVILRNLMARDAMERHIPRFFRDDFEEMIQNSQFIHFGMRDVKKEIDEICDTITKISREKLDALSSDLLKTGIKGVFDIEHHKFSTADKEKLHSILSRQHIGLDEDEKNTIWQYINDNTIYEDNHKALLYLLRKLVVIYDSYAIYDQAIKNFSTTCNKYLFEKKFVFDEEFLLLKLYRDLGDGKMGESIELEQLSSGEKQIVSLFADVYLDKIDEKFIFLIDEPELSLSIFWQRTLLPDVVKSDKCNLLFAVTHSPFIFENEFENNTVGLNEFMQYSR